MPAVETHVNVLASVRASSCVDVPVTDECRARTFPRPLATPSGDNAQAAFNEARPRRVLFAEPATSIVFRRNRSQGLPRAATPRVRTRPDAATSTHLREPRGSRERTATNQERVGAHEARAAAMFGIFRHAVLLSRRVGSAARIAGAQAVSSCLFSVLMRAAADIYHE